MTEESVLDKVLEMDDPEEEAEPEVTEDKGEDKSETPSLEERLAALEKENQGLKATVSAEREKRQKYETRFAETDGKYQALSSTINEVLAKREKEPEPEPEPPVIKLSYDEEGNPFISADVLREATAAETKALKDELATVKQELAQTKAQNLHKTQVDQQNQQVVNEKPEYRELFPKVVGAWKWVMERTARYVSEQGMRLPPNISVGGLLEKVEGTDVEQDFNAQFPGYDFERVFRARATSRDLRKALDSMPAEKADDKLTDTLKQVASKPSGLSEVRNQKGNDDGPTLADIAKMADKIEDLSDADVEKLEAALAKMG